MNVQHTPGPWKDARTADGKLVWFQATPQPPTEHYAEPVNEEHRANMRLLDAAPDLLQALSAVRDRFFPVGQPERDRDLLWEPVNAAIAKATGQEGSAA